MPLAEDLARFSSLHTVEEPVELDLAVTSILRQDEERVVYFADLGGRPAVGNLWASRARICESLGVSREKLPFALLDAIHHPISEEMTKDAGFLEGEIPDFDLHEDLPAPRWYPDEPGRYLTSAIVAAEWAGKRNLSYHRMLVLDRDRLVARLVPRHLRTMMEAALDQGEEIPIAIFIGAPLPVLLAGATSLEYD
ncbi:MAG: UbiD family decarboxylase, partial [Candidatus Thermoplasmatota archaeon]|nr:UbiD family decarboxylase [Candidatus Thermoplasmatota archaeon]